MKSSKVDEKLYENVSNFAITLIKTNQVIFSIKVQVVTALCKYLKRPTMRQTNVVVLSINVKSRQTCSQFNQIKY